MSGEVRLRRGRPGDDRTLLACFDAAVEWLVARGQPEQWGDQPWSKDPRRRTRVRAMAAAHGLWIAELDGEPAGALIVGDRPPHGAPITVAELYVELLITDRRFAGRDIGGLLVRHAKQLAAEACVAVLRVDCWAGAPTLVAWYERQGFRRSDTFAVDGWIGQVFELPLVVLRGAHPGEEPELTELALRSKAHWGYDDRFLEACRAELTVTAEQVRRGEVSVAVEAGRPVGLSVVDLDAEDPELLALFVDPAAMGRGVGRTLLRAAVRRAAAAGVETLVIESDPNAERFYLTNGAHRIGERISPSTGRALPLLQVPVA